MKTAYGMQSLAFDTKHLAQLSLFFVSRPAGSFFKSIMPEIPDPFFPGQILQVTIFETERVCQSGNALIKSAAITAVFFFRPMFGHDFWGG